jgi:uncharacterized protein
MAGVSVKTIANARRRRGPAGLAATVAGVASLALASCSSGPPPPVQAASYEASMVAGRQAKDAFFKTGAESPIPEVARRTFTGLVYFPVDPDYHVPASLDEERSSPPVTITLPTSKNLPRRMVKVGSLRFAVAGSNLRLTAFVGEGEGLERLFVPFGDLTNRQETYGGGRYLELERTATGLYDLDFNRATNPYCVYNAGYDCPIPPAENRLPIPIRAGERMPL